MMALRHALELYDFHQTKITECDSEFEAVLQRLNDAQAVPGAPPPAVRHAKGSNEP
jgi:hypothetical protein